MFVHMGDTDHISVDWLSLITEVKGFTGPLPLQSWPVELPESVQSMFPLQANLLIMSFFATSSACSVHSFAVLCLLVSSFPTSVAGVWQ